MKKDIINEYDLLLNSGALAKQGECEFLKNGEEISVRSRVQSYASPAIDLIKLMGVQKGYKISFSIKLDNAKESDIIILVEVFGENLGCDEHFRKQILSGKVTDEWTKFTTEFKTLSAIDYDKAILAFYAMSSCEETFNYSVKDLCIESFVPQATLSLDFKLPEFKRPEKTLIGAIRWDAWYGTKGPSLRSSQYTSKALSPAKYHYMAPFFSYIDQNGDVQFPTASQEQFDKEAELAIDAGIDYFAYVWERLPENSDEVCRHQHLKSKYKDKLKLCAILQSGIACGENALDLINAMKDPCYLRLDGRPVLYWYSAAGASDETIKNLLKLAKENGIDNIYNIAMASPDLNTVAEMLEKGCEAISSYSCNAMCEPNEGEPYASLAKRVFELNEQMYHYHDRIGVVPLISFGRDSRPRIDNPLPWTMHRYGFKFTFDGTEDELYKAAKDNLTYIAQHPENAKPNMALVYSWNEHDEGSWICPTIAVDEKGEPIKDENGNIKMNRSHLDALKKAISEYRKNEK